jgi:hypothetical protein
VGRKQARFHAVLSGEVLAEVAGYERSEWRASFVGFRSLRNRIGIRTISSVQMKQATLTAWRFAMKNRLFQQQEAVRSSKVAAGAIIRQHIKRMATIGLTRILSRACRASVRKKALLCTDLMAVLPLYKRVCEIYSYSQGEK